MQIKNRKEFSTTSNYWITIFFLSILIFSSLSATRAEPKAVQDKISSASDTKTDTSPSAKQESTDATTNTSIKKPIDNTKQHKQDLQHYLTHEQVKPLLAGPDDYMTLFKKNTTTNSKGVVILLPEWQQGATNPKAINFLRNTLPTQGWNTITIQPENKPENFPSTAIAIDEQIKDNELALTEYKRKLSELFNAVMNTAKEYPGIVIVVAQGNNGALLVENFSQADNQRPNALILLSSYRQSNVALVDKTNDEFAKKLAVSEIPTLDLYLKHDNGLVLAKAPHRKLMATQEMKTYYRQRQLNNTITGYYPEKELLRQINGWLKAIGW